MRQRRMDIKALRTARQTVTLDTMQAFFSTPKAYEIWDVCPVTGEPLNRIKRIDKKRVLWEYARLDKDGGLV